MTHPSLLRETNAFCLFAFFPGGCIVAWRDAFAVPLDCRLMQKSPTTDSVDRRRSALMADAQCGDSTAYAVLLRECVPLIRSVAARRVPLDRLDDVVQDTLLTVHRARQTYDPARSFTAWLCTIADRRAIDVARSLARNNQREVSDPLTYEQHADESTDPVRIEDREEAVSQVRQAVAGLPPRQRQAVDHLMLREQSLAAAAQETGHSEGALKVNLHRALKTLRATFSLNTAPRPVPRADDPKG